ncbi:MAG: flavodoxin domain-containing protein [Polyangiaceae bacterium]
MTTPAATSKDRISGWKRSEPVLVLYATREGHSRRVAQRISGALDTRGVPTLVEDLSAHPDRVDPKRFAAVVLVGSVHFGRHAQALGAYVTSNRAALGAVPTVFVSISMSEAIAHYTEATREQRVAARARAHQAVDAFCAETRFRPKHIQLLGGGLPYTKLGFFTRQLVRLISARQGGPTDTSRDHDLTAWSVIDSIADQVARATGALPFTPGDTVLAASALEAR